MKFSRKFFQKKLLSWSLIDEKDFFRSISGAAFHRRVILQKYIEVTTCAGSTELVNQFVFGGGSSIGCRETDIVRDIEFVRWA